MGQTSNESQQPRTGEERLSRLSTWWTKIREEGAQWVLLRYRNLLLPYLRKVLGPDAEDCFQELAVRLLQADLLRAEQRKGLRAYLKVCVRHLVVDHYWKKAKDKKLVSLPEGFETDADPIQLESGPDQGSETDQAMDEFFDRLWKNDLVQQAFDFLRDKEKSGKRPLHTVFLLHWQNPQLKSPELAARVTAQLGKQQSSGNVRKLLMDARRWFCRRLLEEAAPTVDPPTTDNLARELEELGLLEHCRQCIDKWRRT